jgi:low temperature requirement protein LtrA
MIELFFDLVFVFAITQLSHTLLAHLDVTSALRVAMLMLAVWWVWIYTSWFTNWLDPERLPVRICLFALMAGGLVASVSIPEAFGSRGLAFAMAYAAMQVGRTLFFLWAARGERRSLVRNFQRILAWLSLSAVFWIAGGLATEPMRPVWWAIALAIEVIAPAAYFRVPWLGRSSIADWDVDGSHMAERCGLFVIIALGESLLVTGATFAQTAWTATAVAGVLVAFLGTVAMWWIYFDTGAVIAHHRIAHASDPGRHARIAYTYFHLPIVAGILVGAVADELVLAHPDHADAGAVATILGGPALYLVGTALFKWATNARRWPPLSHLVGLACLLALVPVALAHLASALALAALAAAALIVVAVWERLALSRP